MSSDQKPASIKSRILNIASGNHHYLTLLWAFFSTYVLWYTVFSWSGKTLLLGPDGVFHHYPFLKESLGHEGILSYHFGQGGGAALHPAVGLIPLERILVGAGLSLQNSINWTLIVFQGLAIYFAMAFVRTCRSLYWSDYLLSPLLIGFSPALITRFSAGHVNFILSYMATPAILFLITTLRKNRLVKSFDLALLTFGLAQALSYVGYQTLLYTFVLALPLIAWSAIKTAQLSTRKRDLIALLSLAMAATLSFSWMELKSIIEFVASGESARIPKDTLAAFQYFTPDWNTWSASLFQSPALVSDSIPKPLHHELIFPAFTLLSAFTILFHKRGLRRKLLFLLIPPGITLFIFSFNIPVFSDFMMTFIPGLGAFRVITRFMIPFLTIVVCFILLVYRSKEKVSPEEFLMLVGGTVAGCGGSFLNAGASLLLELSSVALIALSVKKAKWIHLGMGLLVGTSLYGAIERRTQYIAINLDPTTQSNIVSATKSVLERTEYNIVGIPPNVGMFTGRYSLSFYLNPQRSFSELLSAFTGMDETYRMTADFSSPNAPGFFKALFNSTQEVHQEAGRPVIHSVRDSHAVRVPLKTVRMNPSSVERITHDREAGMDYILNILDSPEAPESIPPHCSNLRPIVEKSSLDEIRIRIEGNAQGCYLVLPINYSKFIVANASLEDGTRQRLETIRSHQTLLGVKLDVRTRTVSIRPEIILGTRQLALQMASGLLFIGAWWIYMRRRKIS